MKASRGKTKILSHITEKYEDDGDESPRIQSDIEDDSQEDVPSPRN